MKAPTSRPVNHTFMSEQRDQKLARIADTEAFDVVVIGGGINGIGVFRDLSMQGLRVLLVERNDFCSGCSAAPSRMIHGGLRYLENGEFDLVRESLQERDALLKNAPHMVRPLPTTVPIRSMLSGLFNGAANFLKLRSKPAERGALPIKVGLLLYDWVTRHRRALPKHEFHGRAEVRRRWPMLRRDTRFAATYYDAWISHPERLGLELLDDTEAASRQSVAVNYCTIDPNDNGGFELRDTEGGRSFAVSCRAVVNATGAWVDQTASDLSSQCERPAKMVEGTKGSHLIINNRSLKEALNGHMFYYENSDGRVCILFPYLSNVLVGATDIRVSKPGRTRCEEDEKSYILQSLGSVFPEICIDPADIIFSYSGIRPLPKSDQEFTGRISRGHYVKRLDGVVPQFCMVGGKWTTFRAFAEQTTDRVLEELGQHRRCHTIDKPIGGGCAFPDLPESWIRKTAACYNIAEGRAQHVLDLYGSNGTHVLDACKNAPGDEPIIPGNPYSRVEIARLIETERVVHLSDIVLRRTDLAITGAVSTEAIDTIADIIATRFAWSDTRRQSEIADLKSELDTYHGVSSQMLANRDSRKDLHHEN
jgi:glycerol-3-phosphate dehydrogenase